MPSPTTTITERDFAVDVVRTLRASGHQALWAGGCVRDELLGRIPKDYDVATDATPEQVRRLFRRTVAVGAAFGVVEVLGPKPHKIQVATFRSDVSYSDGRHPDRVVYSSPQEDALRRDFTINGLFYDPLSCEVIDYVGGQADLKKRLLRAIGVPRERFAEDRLRLLRAVRIATGFDLDIDSLTGEAVREMAPGVLAVSAERIAEELRRLFTYPTRARGAALLMELGLAPAIFPEVVAMTTTPQGPPAAPTGNLWQHTLAVLERLPQEASFELAFATLLHDVGKPQTMGCNGDRYTFYDHEHVGRRMATDIAVRLRLSNEERVRIEWLVERHQYLADVRHMRTSKVKTILAHRGIRELLELHRADALASGHATDHVDYCELLLKEWTETDLNPPPLLTGHDLTRRGLTPGPLFKRLLDSVREGQLDGTLKTTQQAFELVERIILDANDATPAERSPQ